MDRFIECLIENAPWLFEGLGTEIVIGIIILIGAILGIRKLLNNSSEGHTQIQKSGKNSINIQSGRDINIKGDDKE